MHVAGEQLARSGQSVAGRRHARLVQHLHEPTRLLYLAEWESPEAFHAYRATAPHPGRADQLLRPPRFRFFRRLTLFEHVFAPIDLVCVCFVWGTPELHGHLREAVRHLHPGAGERFPGLVSLLTGERDDQPAELLVASCWQERATTSAADAATLDPQPDAQLLAPLLAAGGTCDRFVARPVFDAGGYSLSR